MTNTKLVKQSFLLHGQGMRDDLKGRHERSSLSRNLYHSRGKVRGEPTDVIQSFFPKGKERVTVPENVCTGYSYVPQHRQNYY